MTLLVHLLQYQLHHSEIIDTNKIYREKSIPMTALWCPAFSNHG